MTNALHIELDDTDLLADLRTIARQIPDETQRLVEQIGQLIEDASRDTTPVRTGFLRDSIFWERESGFEVVVGPHASYAEFVHARIPYMLMAYQIAEPSIDRLLEAAAERMVRP